MDLWDYENRTKCFVFCCFFFTFKILLSCSMEAEDIMLFLLSGRIQIGEKKIERNPKCRFIGRKKKTAGRDFL